MLKLVKYNPKEFAVKNAPDNKIEKSVQKKSAMFAGLGTKRFYLMQKSLMASTAGV